jgi:hypothetical protein
MASKAGAGAVFAWSLNGPASSLQSSRQQPYRDRNQRAMTRWFFGSTPLSPTARVAASVGRGHERAAQPLTASNQHAPLVILLVPISFNSLIL